MEDPELRAARRPSPSGRPIMSKEYGLLDATEGSLLPWDWAEERLSGARNYWVGTVQPQGRPHAMPVWGIWLEAAL